MRNSRDLKEPVRIAVIGGSGLYDLKGLTDKKLVEVDTPFGNPSDAVVTGLLDGRPLAILARHGRHHSLLPAEVNYRANIYALKSMGVERILSISAVGSMRERIHPRDVVLVDQFIDRTRGRISTFFGEGLVAHIGFADPVCPVVRSVLLAASKECGAAVHDGGTYICVEGPAFSTRAESKMMRSWSVDVIGMTNFQEARLAREAEICYSTMAMVTDYDCWHEEEDDVSVGGLLDNLRANSELAERVIELAVGHLPADRGDCRCGDALSHAILTDRKHVPTATLERLGPIVERWLES